MGCCTFCYTIDGIRCFLIRFLYDSKDFYIIELPAGIGLSAACSPTCANGSHCAVYLAKNCEIRS